MSTYNGEQFLEEQLVSLVNQKGVEVHILIRDDGSTDRTRDILKRWSEKGCVDWYTGENLGWASSFMDTVYNSGEYDYYAFCDQDDVWLPDKCQSAIKHLEERTDGPGLYFSNIISWRDGVEEGLAKKDNLHLDKHSVLMQCVATGNTMVFNRELRDILCNSPHPTFLLAHDFWVLQTAALLGEVYYDSGSHILYRQHGDNQVGVRRTLKWDLKRKLGDVAKLMHDHRRQEEAKSLLACYGQLMDRETRGIVETVANYRKRLDYRLRLLFSHKYVMDTPLRTVSLKSRIIIGRV